jgi:hypothetical protein
MDINKHIHYTFHTDTPEASNQEYLDDVKAFFIEANIINVAALLAKHKKAREFLDGIQ